MYDLNMPLKRQIVKMGKSKTELNVIYKNSLKYKNIDVSRGWRKVYYTNANKKKGGIANFRKGRIWTQQRLKG